MEENNSYDSEMVIFDELKMYGVEFDEVLSAAVSGKIRFNEHVNSRGSTVYTFRRGDVKNWINRRRADDGNA